MLSIELPFDGSLRLMPVELPGVNFAAQQFTVTDSAAQALRAEDDGLNLCHVEPVRVLGCVVELHPADQRVCVARRRRTFFFRLSSTRCTLRAATYVSVQKRLDEVDLTALNRCRDDALFRF